MIECTFIKPDGEKCGCNVKNVPDGTEPRCRFHQTDVPICGTVKSNGKICKSPWINKDTGKCRWHAPKPDTINDNDDTDESDSESDSEVELDSEGHIVQFARTKVTPYIQRPKLPIKKKEVRDKLRQLTSKQAKKVYMLEQKIYNYKLKQYNAALQIRRMELGLDRSE